MAINNVALLGANGNLGASILEALVAAGDFRVTVVKRQSSSSTIPGNVRVVTVDDELSLESLKAAFAGEDAVVTCFPLKDVSQHLRIADAAAATGVRRAIPADFGSCDSSSPRALELVPLFKSKVAVRERLQELAAANPEFSWTSLVSGHFFDWGLRANFLHFDLKNKTADILGDGTLKSSTSTLHRISEAVLKVLRLEEQTKNKMLFMQSFCVSQLDVLAALEKATGSKWDAEHLDAEEFIAEHKAKAEAGDSDSIEHLVFALGALDGDWEARDGFSMDLLGLKNEDLDIIVQQVVDSET
ncbi:Uu.00g079900.m01.CDS01 [Anthostomella pinea]|uniref:Uu.00g079900.m01.CDS01 n=1 Tax=Anthostomella pinea TaxID=933095 RepID=A0AAI8VKV0_9PEZI|nr:Uu.00g079900.m01.CDS01 [Anthostomella pinea]